MQDLQNEKKEGLSDMQESRGFHLNLNSRVNGHALGLQPWR